MERRQKITLAVSAVAVVVLCAFIFYMSAQPAVDSDGISIGVADRLARLFVPGFDSLPFEQQQELLVQLNHPIRKAAHFMEFMVLGMLTGNLVIQIARARNVACKTFVLVATAWAAATLYAVTDEIHQMFVPGRACMVSDMGIDAAGVLAGVVVATLIFCAIRHFGRRRREVAEGAQHA